MICLDDAELKNNVSSTTGLTLVVIDPGIAESAMLAAAVLPGAVAVMLNGDRDGIEQITEILQQYPSVTSLHLICHGVPGMLYLGNSALSLETIDRHAAHLQTWLSHRQNGFELSL